LGGSAAARTPQITGLTSEILRVSRTGSDRKGKFLDFPVPDIALVSPDHDTFEKSIPTGHLCRFRFRDSIAGQQIMAIRPLSFRATESAGRDPRGGSLDPAIAIEDRGNSLPRPRQPEATNWVLGSNAAMRRIAKSIERAAEVECTVLVSGETGTGKELWARLLHRSGPRKSKSFIPVNCAALTPSLAESQLFGHEKGAFTGAAGRSLGIFRAAQGGVVFLDEIGEMPLELQAKLLRPRVCKLLTFCERCKQ
jgi:hypothetical protein